MFTTPIPSKLYLIYFVATLLDPVSELCIFSYLEIEAYHVIPYFFGKTFSLA